MLKRSSIVNNKFSRPYKSTRYARRRIEERADFKGKAMTVCVAAMCDGGNVIFCAADKMLTTGGIQYEPEKSMKLRGIGNKILVMYAGSVSVHSELAAAFGREIATDSGVATRTVEQYARLFSDLWQIRFERIQEREILGRRGLTMASYLANHSTMNSNVVRLIDQELSSFQLPEDEIVEAIFTGKDTEGSHIYVVRDGRVSCHNIEGYAVIGSGYSVAASQFVFARHSPNSVSSKTAYTMHRAKRMSEQASGVGQQSDWYVIVEIAATIHDDLLKVLERIYKKDRKEQEESFKRAEAQINADIQKRSAPLPAAPATLPSSVPQPPSEQSVPAASDSALPPEPSPPPSPPAAPKRRRQGSSTVGTRPRQLRRQAPKRRSG